MEDCTGGCPSVRFSHLHKGTLDLLHSEHWVLGYPSAQGPSSPIAQFGWVARSRKTVGGSKSLLFENDGEYSTLGHFQLLQNCSCILPQICVLTQFSFAGLQTILLTSWLGFHSDILYSITVRAYIDRCVPFPIMSNGFN